MPGITDDMQSLARRLVDPLRAWFVGYGSGYEEGTYTPTYVGDTTAGTTTYSAQVGEWIRIGNVVHVWGLVSWSAATGTGNGQISLPFTARSTVNARYPVALRTNNLAYTGNYVVGFVTSGFNYLIMQQVAATTGAATNIPVDAGGALVAFGLSMPI